MTEEEELEVFSIALAINEMGDQKECAAWLSEWYPHATKEEMEPIIDDCEEGLIYMDLGDLVQLRKEMELVHPSWKRKAA